MLLILICIKLKLVGDWKQQFLKEVVITNWSSSTSGKSRIWASSIPIKFKPALPLDWQAKHTFFSCVGFTKQVRSCALHTKKNTSLPDSIKINWQDFVTIYATNYNIKIGMWKIQIAFYALWLYKSFLGLHTVSKNNLPSPHQTTNSKHPTIF